MSYCRFLNGDIYMYNGADGIVCCACRLTEKQDGWYKDTVLATVVQAHAHLEKHKAAGHKVPRSAIKRLRMEIRGRFPGQRCRDDDLRLRVAHILAGDPLEDTLFRVLELHQKANFKTEEGKQAYEDARLEEYARLADQVIDIVRTES